MANALMNALEPLIGEWSVVLSDARFFTIPNDRLSGHISLSREMNGTVVVMRQRIDDPRFPIGQWVIGGDDNHEIYSALYSDTRDVQRICQMSFSNDEWLIWRNAPGFSQRFLGRVENATRITIDLQYCENGTDWHRDFYLTLTKQT